MNRALGIVSSGLVLAAALSAQMSIDGVAAIVGENIILKSEVFQLAQMNALGSRIDFNSRPDLMQQYQDLALEGLVRQNILLDRARVDSMDAVSDDEVDMFLDQQVDALISQAGSEANLEEALGQSLREFREDYWYRIRDQITAERYQAEKIGSITIARSEVEDFYYTYQDSLPVVDEQYKISQILVPVQPGQSANDRAHHLISGILDSLLAGASFDALAREYSDDLASRERGGDLGFILRGELVPSFEEVAFKLNINQISNIVETGFGLHVIQLLDKQGERIRVRHVLVAIEPDESDREAALGSIRDYYYLLSESPAFFDSVVKVLSVEEEHNQDLGYIGWVEYGQLPHDSYRSALFGAQPGDITPPFETQMGFHILKVLDFKHGGPPTLEEYYPQIEVLALRNKQSLYFESWFDNIRKYVFIKNLFY